MKRLLKNPLELISVFLTLFLIVWILTFYSSIKNSHFYTTTGIQAITSNQNIIQSNQTFIIKNQQIIDTFIKTNK